MIGSSRSAECAPEILKGVCTVPVREVARNKRTSNNGMQLTKAARCAPFAFRSWGQSLRAAFAAEARCYVGLEAL